MLQFTRKNILFAVLLLSVSLLCNTIYAQEKKPDVKTDQKAGANDKPDQKKPKFKNYDEVITKEAKTATGVFTIHSVAGKWYYEIPKNELGKVFLWVSTIKKNATKMGYGSVGYNNQVVKWERKNDQIFLRQMQYTLTADSTKAVFNGVDASSFPPIIQSFDIATFGKDSTLVIDVTEFMTAEKLEFVPKKQFNARRIDPKRSYVEKITPYKDNVETDVVLTFDVDGTPTDPALGSISIVMHYSMVRLPEKPMMPRLADSRVGYFSVSQEDYSRDAHKAEVRTFITRWRLEKKDPAAEISEPVKPIVFYVDRSVPEKWKEYVRKGIEDWKPAFEQAGFKNAIIGKLAPSVQENPGWSTEDASVSSISWLPSTVENAYGPSIADPRSGEILEADVKIFHNVMNLITTWYFAQVSPLDKRAQKLPLPDELMGELLRYVVAHEVGHSLGFPHNGRASSVFPVDSLRNKAFTEKYGNEASIMDYGRFNYVAQPGDNAKLYPHISIYDYFAVEWGYKPFAQVKTPDDEKPFLEKIARRQDTNPFLEFSNFSSYDPTAQSEDMGSDGVEATKLGIKNIERIMDFIIPATTAKTGDDYSLLSLAYTRVLGQFFQELGHVQFIVGGVIRKDKHIGQDGILYTPVAYDKQKAAMKLLNEQAFTTPVKLLKKDILDLVQPSGNIDMIINSQAAIVRNLISAAKIQRMVDTESKLKQGEKTYTVDEMLTDLTNGIFSELNSGKVTIDPYRRKLQRTFVDEMDKRLNPKPSTATIVIPGAGSMVQTVTNADNSDFRPLAKGKLIELKKKISASLSKSADKVVRYHLEDVATAIDKVLSPNK